MVVPIFSVSDSEELLPDLHHQHIEALQQGVNDGHGSRDQVSAKKKDEYRRNILINLLQELKSLRKKKIKFPNENFTYVKSY